MNKIKLKSNSIYSFCIIFVHINRNMSYDRTQKTAVRPFAAHPLQAIRGKNSTTVFNFLIESGFLNSFLVTFKVHSN